MHLVRTYFIFELLHSAACKRGRRYSQRLKSKAVLANYRYGGLFCLVIIPRFRTFFASLYSKYMKIIVTIYYLHFLLSLYFCQNQCQLSSLFQKMPLQIQLQSRLFHISSMQDKSLQAIKSEVLF